MSRIILYPYKMKSHSAKALQKHFKSLNIKCLRVSEGGDPAIRQSDLIINWGNSHEPNWIFPCLIINKIESVEIAGNKLSTFEHLLNEVPVPEFTTAPLKARTWKNVVIRQLLNSHSGRGIFLWNKIDAGVEGSIRNAPLYVQYIPKKTEYRVHVFNNEVIDIQQKRIRNGADKDSIDFKIRSHDRGWIFARENVKPHKSVLEYAVKAVQVLSLDFGAVDIIWNTQRGAFVLEVNTAPGLEGTTVESYANAILKLRK